MFRFFSKEKKNFAVPVSSFSIIDTITDSFLDERNRKILASNANFVRPSARRIKSEKPPLTHEITTISAENIQSFFENRITRQALPISIDALLEIDKNQEAKTINYISILLKKFPKSQLIYQILETQLKDTYLMKIDCDTEVFSQLQKLLALVPLKNKLNFNGWPNLTLIEKTQDLSLSKEFIDYAKLKIPQHLLANLANSIHVHELTHANRNFSEFIAKRDMNTTIQDRYNAKILDESLAIFHELHNSLLINQRTKADDRFIQLVIFRLSELLFFTKTNISLSSKYSVGVTRNSFVDLLGRINKPTKFQKVPFKVHPEAFLILCLGIKALSQPMNSKLAELPDNLIDMNIKLSELDLKNLFMDYLSNPHKLAEQLNPEFYSALLRRYRRIIRL